MYKKLLLSFLFIHVSLYAQCWKSFSLGADFCVAIKTDGTLYAWGNNTSGQLGIGTFENKTVPTRVGEDSDWDSISAGYGFVVAIKANGTMWVWGRNDFGLGIESGNTINIPSQVGAATDWTFVSAGGAHCLAVKNNGTLWGWGRNDFGQLGVGSFSHTNVPVQVGTDNDWKTASAGNLHSIGIKINNTLWSWGYNFAGQLGLGTAGFGAEVNTPAQITAIATNQWKCIAAGGRHSMAITEDGKLWVWGNNTSHALGVDDGSTYKPLPTLINNNTDWKSVAGGINHSLAIKEDNTLWGWGENTAGQLGDGSIANRATPVQIGSDTGWISADAGEQHSAFINSNDMLASGSNGFGQLGINSTESFETPQSVACPPTLGLLEYSEVPFIVYPNPAVEKIMLQNKNNLKIDEIQIFDNTGRFIMQCGKESSSINIQQLRSGLYWLQIYSKGERFNIEIIKL